MNPKEKKPTKLLCPFVDSFIPIKYKTVTYNFYLTINSWKNKMFYRNLENYDSRYL